MKKIALIAVLIISSLSLFGQIDENYAYEYENPISKKGFIGLGFGIGLPYGGLGFRSSYNIADRFSTFAGIGYNFVGAGFNIGAEYDFAVVKRTSFFLSAMGGYNAVTVVEGAPEYTETFYGGSFGTGIKLDSKKQSGNFLYLSIILPLRSDQFYDMYDRIKDDSRIEGLTAPWPVLFSIGYNMGIQTD